MPAMVATSTPSDRFNSSHFWQIAKWVLVTVASGVIASIFTYFVTANLNQQAAIQQQKLVVLEQFDSSGADMDAKLAAFADAIQDRKRGGSDGIEAARKEARAAITVHASKTQAASSIFGSENAGTYIEALGKLRQFIDESRDVQTAMGPAHLHTKLIEVRNRLSREGRQIVMG